MKKYLFFILSISLSLNMFAQENETQMSAEQKAWIEYMTPGETHQRMAALCGEWKSDIKMWMAPGTEPVVSQGKVFIEMILGGRYMQSIHSGIALDIPMEGISIEGFDNATKEYKFVWIDNMGTGIMTGSGKYNETDKTLFYTGTMVDPVSGKEVKFRETIKDIDKDTQLFELFVDLQGKEFQSMEIKLTRIK